MLLPQTLDQPQSPTLTPLIRRNASPCDIVRLQTPYSQSPNGPAKSWFRHPDSQIKQIKLSLSTKVRQRPKRFLKQDDPLIVYSPINQMKKPPINLFIKYLDGEISTQDLVSQTAFDSSIKAKNSKLKQQENQLKKMKNAKFNVLQKFIQEKIQQKATKENAISEIITSHKPDPNKTGGNSFIQTSNSIKKLRELQILFFPKEDIPKTEEPVFNYKQVFNVESDQLLSDITEERNRKNQEHFHQIGKELIIKLSSRRKIKKEPNYIPMEREVIISKDVQLYHYLHDSRRLIDREHQKKLENEKTTFLKYKGTERKIPIKNCLRYQKLPFENPYQYDEQLSEESSLESDSYSYNLSYLRTQDTRSCNNNCKQHSTSHRKQSKKNFFPQVFNQFSPQNKRYKEKNNNSDIKELVL